MGVISPTLRNLSFLTQKITSLGGQHDALTVVPARFRHLPGLWAGVGVQGRSGAAPCQSAWVFPGGSERARWVLGDRRHGHVLPGPCIPLEPSKGGGTRGGTGRPRRNQCVTSGQRPFHGRSRNLRILSWKGRTYVNGGTGHPNRVRRLVGFRGLEGGSSSELFLSVLKPWMEGKKHRSSPCTRRPQCLV